MKYFLLLVLCLVLNAASKAVADDTGSDDILMTVQSRCGQGSQLAECQKEMDSLRESEHLSSAPAQYALAQSLMSVSGIHPASLETSIQILEGLLDADPGNTEYLATYAFAQYMTEPLQGIEGALGNRQYLVLSVLLDRYEQDGIIRADIKRFAQMHFFSALRMNDPFEIVASSGAKNLEFLDRYGDEYELNEFISAVRRSNEWNDILHRTWASSTASPNSDAKFLTDFLYSFCQRTVLVLDEGAYCNKTTTWIQQVVERQTFNDAQLQEMARLLKTTIEIVKPAKIGNSGPILELIASSEIP